MSQCRRGKWIVFLSSLAFLGQCVIRKLFVEKSQKIKLF